MVARMDIDLNTRILDFREDADTPFVAFDFLVKLAEEDSHTIDLTNVT
jgi:hypothetical protein